MSCRFGWHWAEAADQRHAALFQGKPLHGKAVESKHGRMEYKPQYVDDKFEMLDWSTRKMSLEFYLNVRSKLTKLTKFDETVDINGR